MLQQILKDMYIDPELLAELPEDQKQYLFFKMREEQVRRWIEKEKQLENEELKAEEKAKKQKLNGKKVEFMTGEDGKEWVWVMGDHPDDKSIDQILEEEAERKAMEQAENEIRKELEEEKKEKARWKEESEREGDLIEDDAKSSVSADSSNAEQKTEENDELANKDKDTITKGDEREKEEIQERERVEKSKIEEDIEIEAQKNAEEEEKKKEEERRKGNVERRKEEEKRKDEEERREEEEERRKEEEEKRQEEERRKEEEEKRKKEEERRKEEEEEKRKKEEERREKERRREEQEKKEREKREEEERKETEEQAVIVPETVDEQPSVVNGEVNVAKNQSSENKENRQPPPVADKPKFSREGVKLRNRPAMSEEEQLQKMIMRRSREILFDFKSVRARFEAMAKKGAKEMDQQWRTQEEKARAVEAEIRQVRQRVREEKERNPGTEELLAVHLLQAKPSLSPFDERRQKMPTVSSESNADAVESIPTSPPPPAPSKAEVKKREKDAKKRKEEEKTKEHEEKKKKKKNEKLSKVPPPQPLPPVDSTPPLSPSLSSPKPPVPPRPRVTRRPVNRQAACNWFVRDQKPRGAAVMPGSHAVASWFHGLITRTQAESVLEEEPPGTFLLRISERLFGYAVSVRDSFRCKHFLIEALTTGGYRLFGLGEHRIHPTLHAFTEFHRTHPLTSFGQELLLTAIPPSSDSAEESNLYVELFPERPPDNVSSAL